ncbi:hypothetical protein ACOBV8_19505 (plasmid) [Pseudoalteromonas espejiana]
MFKNFGWIVEAKLNAGELENFKAVMNSQVNRALTEAGTKKLSYFTYLMQVMYLYMVRFADADSSHEH